MRSSLDPIPTPAPHTDPQPATMPAGVAGSSTGTSSSNVHAYLDDLLATGAMLNQLGDDCLADSARLVRIEWGLPAGALVLAPGSAAVCTAKIINLTVGLKSLVTLGWTAKHLGTLMVASVGTYKGAESVSSAAFETLLMNPRLGATALLVVVSVAEAAAAGRPLDMATLQREHPEAVEMLTSAMSGALPGTYTADMALLYSVVERLGGRPHEVRTTMTASPDAADAPPASRSISEAFGREPALYDDADHSAHLEVQRVIDPTTGKGAWTVVIPGTSTWSWDADNPFDLTGNLAAQGGQVSAGETAVVAAVKQAMAKEGVLGKGEPVMVIGHSQGGIVATNLARRRGTGLHVTRVVTFGSPVGHLEPPLGTQALNVENSKDPVARLDGFASGQGEPRRTRVVLSDPGSLTGEDGKADPIEPHSVERYRRDYEGYVTQQRNDGSAPVTRFEQGSKEFFTGTAHTYRFDATRQVSDGGSSPSAPARVHDPAETLHERQFGR